MGRKVQHLKGYNKPIVICKIPHDLHIYGCGKGIVL